MMYLLIFVLGHIIIAWHPYKPNLDKKSDQLKGPVKEVVEIISSGGTDYYAIKDFNTNGRLVKLILYGNISIYDSLSTFYSDPNILDLEWESTYSYSNSNKLISIITTRDQKIYSIVSHKYNSVDSLIFTENLYYNDSIYGDSTRIYYSSIIDTINEITVENIDDTISWQKIIYDNQNRILVSINEEYNTTCNHCFSEYYYNQFGKMAYTTWRCTSSIFDDEVCRKGTISYIYDDSSKLVKNEVVLERDDKITRKELIRVYDSTGKLSNFYKYHFEDHVIENSAIFTFNEHEDISKWVGSSYYGKEEHQLYESQTIDDCFYLYDEYGNWLVKDFYRYSKLHERKERIISYY